MKLTDIQKQRIDKLKEEGYSSRYIALKVLGSKTKKSTVNDYLRSKKQKNTNTINPAKILFLDIENAPCLGYYWRRWKTTIYEDQVEQESFILSFAYKWLHNDLITCSYLESAEAIDENDYNLVKKLQKLLSEADIVVTHNGLGHDIPIINTRLLYHNIEQPLPYRNTDTYLIAKKNFKFPSNSLESIANYLKLNARKTKLPDKFNTWKKCVKGDEEALCAMASYNMDDIELLEELYLKLRPWDKLHPNVNINNTDSKLLCSTCGSDDIIKVDKLSYTMMSAYETYRCNHCGKIIRSRKNILNRTNLLTNVQ